MIAMESSPKFTQAFGSEERAAGGRHLPGEPRAASKPEATPAAAARGAPGSSLRHEPYGTG
jgi:hypothetical protein